MDDASGAGVSGGEGLAVSGASADAEAGAAVRRRPVGGGPGITGWRGREPAVRRRWYGPEAEDEILRRVAAGETLAGVCAGGAEAGLPSLNTVLAWASGKREGFAARLDAARQPPGRGAAEAGGGAGGDAAHLQAGDAGRRMAARAREPLFADDRPDRGRAARALAAAAGVTGKR